MCEPTNGKSWGFCAALVVAAAVLRLWNLTALGLTHFDEGSYAMTGRWLATLGREGWIYQPVHAPGLFPTVVGAAYLVFGIHDYVAIAVSAVAGSLTVGAIFWIGREWFGARAGMLAAAFLATAEYHLIFSRLALTDATFTLLFWVALGCLYRAVRDGGRAWWIAGTVATGLCWNTKYHGFFPLAIVGVWLARDVIGRVRTFPVRAFALAVCGAALLYAPWALFVEGSVGYGAVLKTHTAHTLGTGSWLPTPPSTLWFYASHWLTPPLLLLAGAGANVAVRRRDAASTLLLTATIVFAASAMLYMSFPRLLLPVVPALCMLAGVGLDRIAGVSGRFERTVLVVGTAVVLVWNGVGVAKTLAIRTDAYRQAGLYLRGVDAPVVSQMSKNFYFYEDRPSLEMRHHEPAALDAVRRESREIVVAVDPIVERLPEALAWFEAARGRAEPERVFAIEMYEPLYFQGIDPNVSLDAHPRSLAPFRPGESAILVYRISRSE